MTQEWINPSPGNMIPTFVQNDPAPLYFCLYYFSTLVLFYSHEFLIISDFPTSSLTLTELSFILILRWMSFFSVPCVVISHFLHASHQYDEDTNGFWEM